MPLSVPDASPRSANSYREAFADLNVVFSTNENERVLFTGMA